MAKNRITYSNELILRDGKVGIGTSDPTSELSIFGSLEVDGDIRLVSSGTTSGEIIEQKHYRDNGGSIVYQTQDKQLFSVSNDSENKIYVINDENAEPALEVNTSGVTTITNLQQQEIKFLSIGSTESSRITTRHYSNNNGSVVYQTQDKHLFSVDNSDDGITYSITDSEAAPALTVNNSGVTTIRDLYQNSINFTSVGSTANENIEINHYRNIAFRTASGINTDNKGAISFDSAAGISTNGIQVLPVSLLTVENDPTANVLSVSGYNFWSGGPGTPAIDVTREGKVGIGTTTPSADFDISRNTQVNAPIVFRNNAQVQDVLIFSESPNAGVTSSTSIIAEPYTPGVTTTAPSLGANIFRGQFDGSLNGGQLFTILNDNSSLFRINRFVGLSSLSLAPTGQRNIETIFEVANSGNIGIGTTNPIEKFEINNPTQFRNKIRLSQKSNPSNNEVIEFETYTPGVTTYVPPGGASVLKRNFSNNGRNTGQLYTAENNDNTLFRINTIGIGLTTVSSPTTPIYQILDINNSGDINFYDTGVKKILSPAPGFSSFIPDDGDIFRIDTYQAPFIGTFPTVSKALRIDKFGLIEVNRNINQISGITTVGLGSTSTPTINSTMSFELTNNTTLTVRVRGTDGVVRTGIVSLS